jgi:hypothetical protein
MTSRFFTSIIAVLLVSTGAAAAAETARGYGETDYEFSNRRECCEAALLAAQGDGTTKCRTRGGNPRIERNLRGHCETSTGRDGRDQPIHACRSEVEVNQRRRARRRTS